MELGDVMEEAAQEQRISAVEKHLGTIVQVIIAGTLIWIGTTVVQMSASVAVLQERVTLLTQRSARLDELLLQRTDNDWTRKDQDQFTLQLRERLQTLDNRLNGQSAAIDDMRRRLERSSR